MKTWFLGLFFITPVLSFGQNHFEPLTTASRPLWEKAEAKISGALFQKPLSPKIDFDFGDASTSEALLRRYMALGGDVSGGGFGLKVKGTDKVILHDLWCNDKNYIFDDQAARSEDGSLELQLALSRVEAWKTYAPALMHEIEKILRDPHHWNLTTQKLTLNAKDHFEFPGSLEDLKNFHQTYEEIQAAQVDRHTGAISLYTPVWQRMDLKSRAGLLIHESLRLIYLRSVKGYLVPGILQWLTGAIMLRDPGIPLDQRMIESFYEEIVVTLDNTAAADKQRPQAWRTQLCKQRFELVRSVKTVLATPGSLMIPLDAKSSLQNLCSLHAEALTANRARAPWMNLGFTVADLASPCRYEKLSDLPGYTLTYWMQKYLGIGQTWTKPRKPQTAFDLPFVMSHHALVLTSSNYEVVMQKFLAYGDKYCLKRDDFYGAGEEFVALGDVLLETLTQSLKLKQ